MTSSTTMDSPLGPLSISASPRAITNVIFGPHPWTPTDPEPAAQTLLRLATEQLEGYFSGTLTEFELPLELGGTPFQRSVWEALRGIPFGESISYQALGERAGVSRAARAVGGAIGANPIPIIVPCHRVLGAGGAITGYSGGAGIPTKVSLLALENIPHR